MKTTNTERAIRNYYNGLAKQTIEAIKIPTACTIRYYLTAAQLKKFEAGTITRKEAEALAIAKAKKKAAQNIEKATDHLHLCSGLGRVLSVDIGVEWKRSKTWGYNPFAIVTICHLTEDGHKAWERYTGTASGCGYDKRSSAVAEALNKCNALLGELYRAEEKRLGKKARQSRGDVLGYGSGYGALPYFEGGVGIDCHQHILEALGFEWREIPSGNTFDAYTATRRGC